MKTLTLTLTAFIPIILFSQDLLAQTINFDDVASGTNINTHYVSPNGITLSCINGKIAAANLCSGGNVYANADSGAASPPNVISLTSGKPIGVFIDERYGYFRADFYKPVASVSIDAKAVLPPEILGSTGTNAPFLQAFNAQGKFLAQAAYTLNVQSQQWQTLKINRTAGDIAFVAFSSLYTSSYSPVWGEFDNLNATAAVQVGYQGCYNDGDGRALPVQLMLSGATVETCTAAAKAKGYAYAGVQNGGQCFAGNVAGFSKAPADSACNMPCTANMFEYCGGSWLNSIYATGAAPIIQPPPVDQGCYTDDSNRALPIAINAPNSVTIETCVTAARARNLLYAGLQFYGQCYAGNTLGYTKITDPTQAAKDCNTPCTANTSENCGGAWFNRIYKTGATLPAKPSATAYQGCYTDNPNRILPVALMPSGATVDSCVAAAKAKGYAYAGVQFYGQCYAGDTQPPQSLKVADPNHSQCNTLCTADQTKTEYCGGGWFNSVWSTK